MAKDGLGRWVVGSTDSHFVITEVICGILGWSLVAGVYRSFRICEGEEWGS